MWTEHVTPNLTMFPGSCSSFCRFLCCLPSALSFFILIAVGKSFLFFLLIPDNAFSVESTQWKHLFVADLKMPLRPYVLCVIYLTCLRSREKKGGQWNWRGGRGGYRVGAEQPYVEERPYVLSWRNGVLWAESGPQPGILNDIILEQNAMQAGDGLGLR